MNVVNEQRMELAFELADVRKRYDRGGKEALKGISLSVPMTRVGLLGPNGAGKSTLLRLMLGLLPFEGAATVLGYDARTSQANIRARIGYMPERDATITGLSAVELCSYAAELSGLPHADAIERAHSSLEYVGLGDKRYQVIDGYSTGMKQRVKLAQAIVHDPKVLFLDEPTNGLDPEGREEMLALIAELPSRSGCAVVLSSHLLHDVERTCERAILLHQGTVIYSGRIDELRAAGQEDIYEVRVKTGEEILANLLSQRGCHIDRENTLLLVKLPANASTDLIFSCADERKLQVRHLQPRRLSLESAYVRAVHEAGGTT